MPRSVVFEFVLPLHSLTRFRFRTAPREQSLRTSQDRLSSDHVMSLSRPLYSTHLRLVAYENARPPPHSLLRLSQQLGEYVFVPLPLRVSRFLQRCAQPVRALPTSLCLLDYGRVR